MQLAPYVADALFRLRGEALAGFATARERGVFVDVRGAVTGLRVRGFFVAAAVTARQAPITAARTSAMAASCNATSTAG